MKIGYTGRRSQVRMAEGQTFVPRELTLLVESFGTEVDETRLHRLFREDRVRGEWFTYSPMIQELIQYLLDGGDLQVWMDGMDAVSSR